MKNVIEVPHFAQYIDVLDPYWKERSCAIVSLCMVMNYYGKEVDVHEVLELGLKQCEYDPKVGWRHDVIVSIAKHYGFEAHRTENDSINTLLESLSKDEPVIVSIYKNFDPTEGGHLAVLTGYFVNSKTGEVISLFVNDPIGLPYKYKNKGIPLDVFEKGWKKRAIYVRKRDKK